MKLREALIRQAPSLVLMREAHAEICRLDAEIARLRGERGPAYHTKEDVREADRIRDELRDERGCKVTTTIPF